MRIGWESPEEVFYECEQGMGGHELQAFLLTERDPNLYQAFLSHYAFLELSEEELKHNFTLYADFLEAIGWRRHKGDEPGEGIATRVTTGSLSAIYRNQLENIQKVYETSCARGSFVHEYHRLRINATYWLGQMSETEDRNDEGFREAKERFCKTIHELCIKLGQTKEMF